MSCCPYFLCTYAVEYVENCCSIRNVYLDWQMGMPVFLLPGVLFFLKIMSIFRILFLYLGMFLDFLLWYNIKDVLLLEIDVF